MKNILSRVNIYSFALIISLIIIMIIGVFALMQYGKAPSYSGYAVSEGYLPDERVLLTLMITLVISLFIFTIINNISLRKLLKDFSNTNEDLKIQMENIRDAEENEMKELIQTRNRVMMKLEKR